ncbi:MAG: ABC transporter substrate-binding protein [Chloroflexota bacterium]
MRLPKLQMGILLVVALVLMACAPPAAPASDAGADSASSESAESADAGSDAGPIKIAINEWTGQHVTAHFLGNVLEHAGLEVEYVTAGAVPQFAALAEGTIHMQPEVWNNNVGEIYPEAVADGTVIEIGSLGLNNREGWAYPKYMEEMCPGLPSMQGLIDCAETLATAETAPQGRLLAYPADWGTRTIDAVAALDLPFVAVPAGSEGAQIAEIQSAVVAEQPLVLMFWAPHWIHAEVEMGWVDIEPAYEDDCLEDPAWGPNPDMANDCDFAQALVLKSMWAGVAETWPVAQTILEQFTLDGTEQSKMVIEIDQNGRDIDEVIDEWMAANEALWMPWVESVQ